MARPVPKETVVLGLTPLGVLHTAVSLVAVAAGVACFLRYGGISLRTSIGRVYVYTTLITAITGFGIFQHGGFGKPHALGVATLLVLAVAYAAGRTRVFGNLSRYVETVSYSGTFFFHMIPGITETATRLPPRAPLAASAEAPGLQTAAAIMFVLFLAGATYQVWRLHRQPAPAVA